MQNGLAANRWTEPRDADVLRPGLRLGRYELLVPIATGGMARVWAARQQGQRGFQKLVAIKTILPHLARLPEFERMFLDEARIASRVHHPNVCEIYDLGEEREILYLAMEWINGDSLVGALRYAGAQEALDPAIAARIVADACAGVHAAHELCDEAGRELGVVHRDLSPHNLLLTADGNTKVCDFGVAKALGRLQETAAGQIKGKVPYMSPEQINGGVLDRLSDVFSLGCVLYEASTGRRPFEGDSDFDLMLTIVNGDVEPPTSIVAGYPPELERIVLRALAREPSRRYPTAEQMRFALEEYLTKGPLVTQANVGQLLRTRLGDVIDSRNASIKRASHRESQSVPSSFPPSSGSYDQSSGVRVARRRREDPTGPSPQAPTPPSRQDVAVGGYAPATQAVSTGKHTRLLVAPVGPAASGPIPYPFASQRADVAPRLPPSFAPRAGTAAPYVIAALIGVLLALGVALGTFVIWTKRGAMSERASRPALSANASALAVPATTSSLVPGSNRLPSR